MSPIFAALDAYLKRMQPKRWVASGIIAACCLVPLAPGCGSDSFTSDAPDGSDSETSTADGSATDAASSDGNVGDGAVFCVARPNQILCADFDEPDLRTALTVSGSGYFFSSTVTTDGGKLFRSGGGQSPPNSLETSIVALAGDASVVAQTAGALTDAPKVTHFKLTASLRFNSVGDLSGAGTLGIMGFALIGPPDSTTSYQVIVNGGHVAIVVLNDTTVVGGIDLGVVPVPSADWLPFVADITLGVGGKLTASLGTVNGSALAFADLTHTQANLALGVGSSGRTGALDISYDNVVVSADKSDAGAVSVMDSGSD
jgi:hypothetical protein